MKDIPKLDQKKHRLIDAYIHHRNLLNKGRGEFGWLEGIVKTLAVMGAIATPDIVRENFLLASFFFLGLQVCFYFVGWWWEVRRYYQRENEWGNERNLLAKELREAIKK